MWVLIFWMGSDPPYSPSNSVWIYLATAGKGWFPDFPEEGNEQSTHQQSEKTLETMRCCYCWQLSCLGIYLVGWNSISFFHHTQNWNYHCKKSYKLCSLWSIWTSQIVSHSTWSCAPEIDWQRFNYLGCRRRQNQSLRSSQEAQKVLSKPCCYQMETTRTRPKL